MMDGYQVLNDQVWQSGVYEIESIRLEDAELIRQWRNEQISALRQSRELSMDDQALYFREHVMPEFDSPYPGKILVRFTLKGSLIGYGGIVHINWADRRGEVSFLLETKRANDRKKYVKEIKIFLKMLSEMAFIYLGFNKLTTESYNHRLFHVEAIENFGFRREGVLRKHTMINGQWIDSIIASLLKEDFSI
jgi:RimJ/RimL family protein N-acetyltransferase